MIFPEAVAEDAAAVQAYKASTAAGDRDASANHAVAADSGSSRRASSPVKRQRLNSSLSSPPVKANSAAAPTAAAAAAAPAEAAAAAAATTNSAAAGAEDHVTFHLVPANDVDQPLPALEKPVLRTTATITVAALAKFVMKKLKLVNVTVAQVSNAAC